MWRFTGQSRRAINDGSGNDAMRIAASKPSPIRSTVASLEAEVDGDLRIAGEELRQQMRHRYWCRRSSASASRTSPRGVADCASASFSSASPSASNCAAFTASVLPELGQRQPP